MRGQCRSGPSSRHWRMRRAVKEREMIWHIFRKDCRVLYMAIAGAALAHAIAAGTWIAVGPFEPRSTLSTAANMLSALGLTLAVVVSVMAVHEDLLSGATSDWAVRPIRRRHMLWAKI